MPRTADGIVEVTRAIGGGGGITIIDRDLSANREAASVTRTAKAKVPVEDGVPEITPVFDARLSPAGRAPLLNVQLYGAVPPETVSCCEYPSPISPDERIDVATSGGRLGCTTLIAALVDIAPKCPDVSLIICHWKL